MWKLSNRAHRVYDRNPLVAVLFAVDFEPILQIGEPSRIAGFQDRIRSRFPQYSEGQSIEVQIEGLGKIISRQEKAFEFGASPELKISLTPRRISREARAHRSRSELVDDVALVMKALEEIYSPIVVTRVGLRYVNLIDLKRISADLGESVTWSSLVADSYMKVPAGVLDMDGTYFSHEISSSMNRGSMVLRYGLHKRIEPGEERDCVHFDIDRFVMEPVNPSSISTLVEEFSVDIYDLYMTAAGPSLMKWMTDATASRG